jgi:hypothetical protein
LRCALRIGVLDLSDLPAKAFHELGLENDRLGTGQDNRSLVSITSIVLDELSRQPDTLEGIVGRISCTRQISDRNAKDAVRELMRRHEVRMEGGLLYADGLELPESRPRDDLS